MNLIKDIEHQDDERACLLPSNLVEEKSSESSRLESAQCRDSDLDEKSARCRELDDQIKKKASESNRLDVLLGEKSSQCRELDGLLSQKTSESNRLDSDECQLMEIEKVRDLQEENDRLLFSQTQSVINSLFYNV